ncbi:hypothetical protein B0H17DRAFT_1143312 [Mycena rosella]|uniref:Ndc10 domain-containing protein n=1 Tax=Mycena rosella TaxID=1033263 RepID=A0AAD7CVG9_MYCRO|nr:hypothetical protein B0H17DRAFT_1143312 [Mycena rosella]
MNKWNLGLRLLFVVVLGGFRTVHPDPSSDLMTHVIIFHHWQSLINVKTGLTILILLSLSMGIYRFIEPGCSTVFVFTAFTALVAFAICQKRQLPRDYFVFYDPGHLIIYHRGTAINRSILWSICADSLVHKSAHSKRIAKTCGAVGGGRRKKRKALKNICLEFHVRIDWCTEDHEEPVVKDWDPKAKLVQEKLSAEDELRKRECLKALDVLGHTLRVFVAGTNITSDDYRRLRKQGHLSSSLDPAHNPYAVLLAKLSGLTAPPKARQGYQQFMQESYMDKIASEVLLRWQAGREARTENGEKGKEPKAGFRAAVARNLFAKLPSEECQAIGDRAKKEAADAKEAYVKMLKDPPPQDPVSRYKCIQSVGEFLGPILQGLHAYTGLHSTIMLGGPMPQFSGELDTIHVSFGRNKSALGQHWPQWDKPRFSSNVQNFMTEYLHTAFDAEDCKRAALPKAGDLDGTQYTIAPGGNGGGNTTDSDSDSDSNSNSNSDLDDESDGDDDEDARPQKKAKVASVVQGVCCCCRCICEGGGVGGGGLFVQGECETGWRRVEGGVYRLDERLDPCPGAAGGPTSSETYTKTPPSDGYNRRGTAQVFAAWGQGRRLHTIVQLAIHPRIPGCRRVPDP